MTDAHAKRRARRRRLAERAAELRDQGLSYRQIARQLEVAERTVANYLWDPGGAKTAAVKERYRGRCERCGRATSGGDGPGRHRVRCAACAKVRWDEAAIAAAIIAWRREHARAPTTTDWRYAGPGHPSARTVARRCGSLAAAVMAAGC